MVIAAMGWRKEWLKLEMKKNVSPPDEVLVSRTLGISQRRRGLHGVASGALSFFARRAQPMTTWAEARPTIQA